MKPLSQTTVVRIHFFHYDFSSYSFRQQYQPKMLNPTQIGAKMQSMITQGTGLLMSPLTVLFIL